MTTGLPGVGLNLLMPDYAKRMTGLARNVEDGRIRLLLAVLSAHGRQHRRQSTRTSRLSEILGAVVELGAGARGAGS